MFNNNVAVIGMGFVGLPMAIAIASSKNFFKVIGIEQNNSQGVEICKKINNRILPIDSEDLILKKKFLNSVKKKNFYATTNLDEVKKCGIVIISI